MIRALPKATDIQLRLPISTNVFKMQTILLEFQLHAEK